MRLGLIGATGHWQTYAPALKTIPDLTLVAVAIAGDDETLGAFDHAPGLTIETRRYEDARRMLETERLEIVQVCCRPDRIPYWSQICLERGLPVVAEKPLAMDLPTLQRLYRAAQQSKVPLIPMHTMRGVAELAAVQQAVREGKIGMPLVGYHQKTYKWGKTRPDSYRRRATFPGIAPYIGIHAFDWMHWILGDCFTEIRGCEGATARPDFPACASQAGFVLTMKNGGVMTLSLDYLRPESAPTHGDERVRIAGTDGVIETQIIENKVTLITAREKPTSLPLTTPPDIFTQFVRSLRGEMPPPLSLSEAFRITEIAIKAQQAADTKRPVSLLHSPFTT